jgi:RNA polymerase sigma-70 factor (ECF subfamily)
MAKHDVTTPSADPMDPSTSQGEPILELVKQVQAGIRVEENFEQIFRRFRPVVHSFFRRKGFSPETSTRLTQDVFLRVFKSIDSFRGESRFERWLWEIADHVYFNELRRRNTEERAATRKSDDQRSSPVLELSSDDLSPEDLALREQRITLLRAAFQDLPDHLRECCILRYERGLEYQEIAALMKISLETVKAQLYQARKQLSGRFAEERGRNG